LTELSHDTERDLSQALQRLSEKSGIKGLILDLRSNPGGLLDGACKTSRQFIDDGVIFSFQPRSSEEVFYLGKGNSEYRTFPMVCLVNGATRRASEFIAACLQDHGRAVIVGERSSGSGHIQTVLDFDGHARGALIVTTAVFRRPSGKNVHKGMTNGKETEDWGVKPDQGFAVLLPPKERERLEAHLESLKIIPRRDAAGKQPAPQFRDRQLELALTYLRDQTAIPTAKGEIPRHRSLSFSPGEREIPDR
jgi:carboxyl-terminal processing protease